MLLLEYVTIGLIQDVAAVNDSSGESKWVRMSNCTGLTEPLDRRRCATTATAVNVVVRAPAVAIRVFAPSRRSRLPAPTSRRRSRRYSPRAVTDPPPCDAGVTRTFETGLPNVGEPHRGRPNGVADGGRLRVPVTLVMVTADPIEATAGNVTADKAGGRSDVWMPGASPVQVVDA